MGWEGKGEKWGRYRKRWVGGLGERQGERGGEDERQGERGGEDERQGERETVVYLSNCSDRQFCHSTLFKLFHMCFSLHRLI